MTNVKQLRDFLATLPDDLPVEVLKETCRAWDTSTNWVPLVLPREGQRYSETCDPEGFALQLGQK